MIVTVYQPQFSFYKAWILKIFDSQYCLDSKSISHIYVHVYDWFCKLVQFDQIVEDESLRI